MSESREEIDAPVDAGLPPPDAPPPEPAPVAEVAPAPPSGGDEFDALLKQWDEGVAKPAPEPAPAPAPEPAATDPAAPDELDQLLEKIDRDAAQAKVEQDARVQQRLQQIEQQRLFENADKVGDRIKDDVFARYRDTHVVDRELLDSWLEREANNDPRLKQAFINAVMDPRGVGDRWGRTNEQIFGLHYGQLLKRLDETLRPQARDNIAATEDRGAVVASVLRAGRGGDVPEPPINWGQLSDQEFRAERNKLGLA